MTKSAVFRCIKTLFILKKSRIRLNNYTFRLISTFGTYLDTILVFHSWLKIPGVY